MTGEAREESSASYKDFLSLIKQSETVYMSATIFIQDKALQKLLDLSRSVIQQEKLKKYIEKNYSSWAHVLALTKQIIPCLISDRHLFMAKYRPQYSICKKKVFWKCKDFPFQVALPTKAPSYF